MPEDNPRRRYTANLQGEVDSAALYRTLAQTEKNPHLAQVYRRLAAIEEAHAEYWKNHIAAIDHKVPNLRPGFRTRALLGANDGLCSNLSLVMGVAGADLAPHAILITGLGVKLL
jgi:Rubrerythrin